MSFSQAPAAMLPVCVRLAQERLRLGLKQSQVAVFAEVASKTIGRWEKEIAIPADRLEVLTKLGFDALYVVTGRRDVQNLAVDECELLELYRAAPIAVKAAAIGALTAGAGDAKLVGSIGGSGHRFAIGGDYNEKCKK